jgi:integrase
MNSCDDGGRNLRKSLPLSDWPPADRLAWAAAIQPGADVFEDAGHAARWAASTRAAVQYDYGRWLGFVARSEPDALRLDPASRASSDRLLRFLAHLAETAGSVSRHSTLRHLRDALVVMAPGWDRRGLDRLVAQLERDRQPRPKPPRMISTQRLIALGYELMERVPTGGILGPQDLLAYRDGLMIALLASRPLRRRNFVAIEIGRHLIRVGDGFHLAFDRSETKTGQPIETDVPADLVPRLVRYLAEIRPRFPRARNHRALWAGFKGGLRGQAVYDAIAARTQVAFGHVVNVHLFRDCAATTIAITQPGQIGVARDLLGHASLHTTNAYYIQARSLEASRLHAEVVSGCRAPIRRLHESKPTRSGPTVGGLTDISVHPSAAYDPAGGAANPSSAPSLRRQADG